MDWSTNNVRHPMRDVTVIGGGPVALATALRLLQDGHRVRLIADQPPRETTGAGSGSMFSLANVLPLATRAAIRDVLPRLLDPGSPISVAPAHLPRMLPWIWRMVRHSGPAETERISRALAALLGPSIDAFRPLIDAAGAQPLVRMAGHLVLYPDAAAREADRPALDARRAVGVKAVPISDSELAQLEPNLPRGRFAAVYFPDSGHVLDAGVFLERLAEAVAAAGGELVRDRVVDLVVEGGRASAAIGARGRYPLDVVVVAAGVGSRALARRLGHRVPLEAERGYHLTVPGPGGESPLRRPVVPIAFRLGVTPQAGGLRAGGTIEFSGLGRPAARRRLDLLARGVKALFPDLDLSRATEWSGYRPTLPDWLPVIGPATRCRDAFLAFGHQHVGLTTAAVTGGLIADLVAGRRPGIDIAPYRVDRFS